MPTELRTAKYSNFSDIWYFSATRYPAQWLHRPVVLAASTRGWNGVVRYSEALRAAAPPA